MIHSKIYFIWEHLKFYKHIKPYCSHTFELIKNKDFSCLWFHTYCSYLEEKVILSLHLFRMWKVLKQHTHKSQTIENNTHTHKHTKFLLSVERLKMFLACDLVNVRFNTVVLTSYFVSLKKQNLPYRNSNGLLNRLPLTLRSKRPPYLSVMACIKLSKELYSWLIPPSVWGREEIPTENLKPSGLILPLSISCCVPF